MRAQTAIWQMAMNGALGASGIGVTQAATRLQQQQVATGLVNCVGGQAQSTTCTLAAAAAAATTTPDNTAATTSGTAPFGAVQAVAGGRVVQSCGPPVGATGQGHRHIHTSASALEAPGQGGGQIQWVFLGAPGVGKGTYASRAAKHFGVAHIATGDLIRAEIKSGSSLGKQFADLVNHGSLVPDELIMDLLNQRLAAGASQGERGFILDGFPRTRPQAEKLLSSYQLQVAFNLTLREEVLIQKCLGRRTCGHCGKGYNIADIHLPADPAHGKPAIIMPPLSPPPECEGHLESREDDTEPVIRRRLQAYRSQAGPVEDFFRSKGLLHDFEITKGIPETLPGLLAILERFVPGAQ